MRGPKGASKHPIFAVDSPYASPRWPEIDETQKSAIMDLLCELLEPMGCHRSAHIKPSKGKRDKKRKREQMEKVDDEHVESANQPPAPIIGKHVTVGLNSTSRRLEAFAKPDQDLTNTTPLAAVFLTQSPLAFQYTHLPVLTALATSAHREIPAPRLVPLDSSAEQRLTRALGIPRVGVIGVLQDAPGAGPLIEYVREHIRAVEVPWVKETTEGKFLGTKINAE